MSFNSSVSRPRIIHYAGVRREKWHSNPEVRLYMDMSWDEAMEMHEMAAYSGKPVLFTSDHSLLRAENLRAVWGACKLPKEFKQGTECMSSAEKEGYSAVVCDTLPRYIPGKRGCKSIVIGHGITGDKKYALDERRDGIDKRAFGQIDVAVNASTQTVGIVAAQFGIPEEKVAALGMPRTDSLVGKSKGDGGTFLSGYKRAYLYAPTYRSNDDGGHMPRIDWEKLDAMLDDDEIIVVKRHYFQDDPIVEGDVGRIAEVGPSEPSAPYLIDCDVVMTDYSSIVFDAYVAGKPSVLLVDDMDEYLKNRGMYLKYPKQYSSRWLVAEGNEDKLLAHLRGACVTGMRAADKGCLSLVADMCDGHSAERVAEFIRKTVIG